MILFATTANADFSNSISADIVPPNPSPHQNITITLKSFIDNLDGTLISWSVDGKVITSGMGKKSFSTTTSDAGVETDVVATIYLPDGAIEKNIPIIPLVMVLLWQANDSYVPPFYRGKALATPSSEVKVVAMPEIQTSSGLVDSRNLTYAWQQDYTNNVDGSGYGKNSFTYVNDYLEDSNTISVTASTVDQKYSSQASIVMGMVQPEILFYKNDEGMGTIWESTLADEHKIEGSEIVQAVPYFISPKQLLNPGLVWDWFINDQRVNLTSFKKNFMPLQTQSGTSGTAKLRLEITNKYKIFQNTSKEINIEF